MTGSGSSSTRWQPRPGTYLAVLLVGVVLTLLVLQLLPDWRIGPVPGVALVVVAYLALAVVAWAREPRTPRPEGLLAWFLLAYLLQWIVLMSLLAVRQEEVSVTALVTPVLVLMVWFRLPTRAAATRAADVLAVAIVAAVAVALLAEMLGLVGSWYGASGADLAASERGNYWVPLAGPLGLDGRWAGPFVHPNLAGPVGAFLVVFGMTRPRWRRPLFVAVGALVLVLASSRTSLVSVAAGLLVLLAAWWFPRPGALPRWLRTVVVSLPAVVFALALVIVNPGMTGRTSVWPVMADLWRDAPLLGIGDAGFEAAVASGRLPAWAHHAHNVLFDAGVRTGVIGLALALAVLVLALVITVGAAARGHGVGLALVVVLLVGGLADTILHWRFVTVPAAVLILAVLMSARPASPSVAPAAPPPPARARGTDRAPDPAPST